MPDIETIIDNLIRGLMFYGLYKDWTPEELVDKYKLLEIDKERVSKVLDE